MSSKHARTARDERLALVIEATNDGIWDWNLETNDVYYSPRWKAMLGYDDSDLADRFESWERLIHPGDRQRAHTELHSYLSDERQSYRLEHRLRHKDGSYRWILARGTALRRADGTPYRMVGSHADITELKQAEEAIRQSEKRFSQAFHASPVPMIMTTPLDDARYLEVNAAWLRLMGYTRAEVIGHTWQELRTWARPEQRASMVAELQASGSVRNEEYLTQTKSGELRNILLSAEMIELNDQPHMLYFIYDITERKRAEDALRARETQLSLIHDNVYDVIFSIGVEPHDQFRFTGVNQRFLEVTGLADDQVVGKLVQDVIPESARVLVLEKYREAIQNKQPTHWEEESAYPTGTNVGAVTVAPIFDETGHCTQLIGTVRDITELKEKQQLLERRVAERTHELAALNEIAAVVSRSLDVKEILNAALNKALEMMKMEVGVAYCIQEEIGPIEVQFVGNKAPRGLSTFTPRQGVDFLRVPLRTPQGGEDVQQPTVWLVAELLDHEVGQALELEGVRQIIHVPLVAKRKLVGRFILGARRERVIMPEEISLLASIGQHIAVAVENGILYNQAEHAAAIAERQRLSRELHDSVTQSLYSMTLYAEATARLLESGHTTTAVQHLRELRDTAQEALREMRLLIFELRPLALEKVGLVPALQARLDSVEARSGTHTELQVDGVQIPGQLPYAVEQELYHIAQEALNNVLKHARAHKTRVHLQFSESETLLEICDDGVGFAPGTAGSAGGLGLASLTERAQHIGATLDMDSAPGSGTRIRVVVHGSAAQRIPS